MKSLIITVYNSFNYGSYLQAKALMNEISKYSEVRLYNSKTRSLMEQLTKRILRTIAKRKHMSDVIKGPIFEIVEMLQLRKCWKTMDNTEDCNADIVVLGSDEIWNISREYCLHRVYWGNGIDSIKISYAPSISNATYEDFSKHPEYITDLKELDAISVRDTFSRDVLSRMIDKDIQITIDPTLLSTPKSYPFKFSKPFIAVYTFEGSFNEEDRKEVIGFARDKGLALVSCGQYLSWCDYSVHSIDGTPFYVFEHAEYVITNTFHGTAYAINYQTRFAAFVKKKNKALDMLKQFELDDRIVMNSSDLSAILDQDINYDIVNGKIQEKRRVSKQFLENVFKGAIVKNEK